MMQDLEELETRLKSHVETQDKLLEGKLKMWIMSAIIINVIPLVTIAFFIGGIYQSLNTSIKSSQDQAQQLAANERWMQERRQWELAVEIWGAQQMPPLRTPGQPNQQRPSE